MRCEIYNLSSGVGLRGTWNPESLTEHRENNKRIFKVAFEGSNKREDCQDFLGSLLAKGESSQFVSELCIWEGQLSEYKRRLRAYGSGYRDSFELTWHVPVTESEPEKQRRWVTVRQGETLTDVAARVYADPRLWRLLARANGIVDGLRLRGGQELKVPPAPQ